MRLQSLFYANFVLLILAQYVFSKVEPDIDMLYKDMLVPHCPLLILKQYPEKIWHRAPIAYKTEGIKFESHKELFIPYAKILTFIDQNGRIIVHPDGRTANGEGTEIKDTQLLSYLFDKVSNVKEAKVDTFVETPVIKKDVPQKDSYYLTDLTLLPDNMSTIVLQNNETLVGEILEIKTDGMVFKTGSRGLFQGAKIVFIPDSDIRVANGVIITPRPSMLNVSTTVDSRSGGSVATREWKPEYEKSTSEQQNKIIYPSLKKEHKAVLPARIGVEFGLGKIIGDDSKYTPKSLKDYTDELKNGKIVGLDLVFFSRPNLAFGIFYSNFWSSNAIVVSNEKIKIGNYYENIGLVKDNVRIQVVGGQIFLCTTDVEGVVVYGTVGVGMLSYTEEGRIAGIQATMDETTMGFRLQTGVDIMLNKNLALGVGVSLILGKFDEFEFNDIRVESDETMSATHLNISAGFKIYF